MPNYNLPPEDQLKEAKAAIYAAHYQWAGPDEAEENLEAALAEIQYAEEMWLANSEEGME